MNPILDTLLADAEAFANEAGLKLSTVSNKLFGHGSRIDDYRAGRVSPSLSTISKAHERLTELRAAREGSAA